MVSVYVRIVSLLDRWVDPGIAAQPIWESSSDREFRRCASLHHPNDRMSDVLEYVAIGIDRTAEQ